MPTVDRNVFDNDLRDSNLNEESVARISTTSFTQASVSKLLVSEKIRNP